MTHTNTTAQTNPTTPAASTVQSVVQKAQAAAAAPTASADQLDQLISLLKETDAKVTFLSSNAATRADIESFNVKLESLEKKLDKMTSLKGVVKKYNKMKPQEKEQVAQFIRGAASHNNFASRQVFTLHEATGGWTDAAADVGGLAALGFLGYHGAKALWSLWRGDINGAADAAASLTD